MNLFIYLKLSCLFAKIEYASKSMQHEKFRKIELVIRPLILPPKTHYIHHYMYIQLCVCVCLYRENFEFCPVSLWYISTYAPALRGISIFLGSLEHLSANLQASNKLLNHFRCKILTNKNKRER